MPYDVEETIAAARNSPAYQQAAGWYQLNSCSSAQPGIGNRVFFRFLQEEQQRSPRKPTRSTTWCSTKLWPLPRPLASSRKPARDLPRTHNPAARTENAPASQRANGDVFPFSILFFPGELHPHGQRAAVKRRA